MLKRKTNHMLGITVSFALLTSTLPATLNGQPTSEESIQQATQREHLKRKIKQIKNVTTRLKIAKIAAPSLLVGTVITGALAVAAVVLAVLFIIPALKRNRAIKNMTSKVKDAVKILTDPLAKDYADATAKANKKLKSIKDLELRLMNTAATLRGIRPDDDMKTILQFLQHNIAKSSTKKPIQLIAKSMSNAIEAIDKGAKPAVNKIQKHITDALNIISKDQKTTRKAVENIKNNIVKKIEKVSLEALKTWPEKGKNYKAARTMVQKKAEKIAKKFKDSVLEAQALWSTKFHEYAKKVRETPKLIIKFKLKDEMKKRTKKEQLKFIKEKLRKEMPTDLATIVKKQIEQSSALDEAIQKVFKPKIRKLGAAAAISSIGAILLGLGGTAMAFVAKKIGLKPAVVTTALDDVKELEQNPGALTFEQKRVIANFKAQLKNKTVRGMIKNLRLQGVLDQLVKAALQNNPALVAPRGKETTEAKEKKMGKVFADYIKARRQKKLFQEAADAYASMNISGLKAFTTKFQLRQKKKKIAKLEARYPGIRAALESEVQEYTKAADAMQEEIKKELMQAMEEKEFELPTPTQIIPL